MNKLAFAVLVLTATSPAVADDLYGDQGGGITKVKKGVWELDVGALATFSNDKQGDVSSTRLATDFNASVNYFLLDNISVGLTGLFAYSSDGSDNTALTLGAAAGGTLHLRLGQGAFFRPGLALGALFGNREIPIGGGTVMEASQSAFTARLKLPIAYYISPRFHLEGGPQLNFTTGSFTPDGGSSTSFTTIDGGFAVGFGYSF
jgi:hypothetical protein